MITAIAHICIGSRDLAATERFYCEGLGLRKVFDFLKSGAVVGYYLRAADRSYIEVFHQDAIDPETQSPMRHICLEVDDIAAVARRLKDHGYAVTDKQLGADQSWQVWTADPAGVKIEFHQYTEKSSQVTGNDCIIDW